MGETQVKRSRLFGGRRPALNGLRRAVLDGDLSPCTESFVGPRRVRKSRGEHRVACENGCNFYLGETAGSRKNAQNGRKKASKTRVFPCAAGKPPRIRPHGHPNSVSWYKPPPDPAKKPANPQRPRQQRRNPRTPGSAQNGRKKASKTRVFPCAAGKPPRIRPHGHPNSVSWYKPPPDPAKTPKTAAKMPPKHENVSSQPRPALRKENHVSSGPSRPAEKKSCLVPWLGLGWAGLGWAGQAPQIIKEALGFSVRLLGSISGSILGSRLGPFRGPFLLG